MKRILLALLGIAVLIPALVGVLGILTAVQPTGAQSDVRLPFRDIYLPGKAYTVYLSSIDMNAKELPKAWQTGTGFLFLKDGEPMVASVNHINPNADVLWARVRDDSNFYELRRVRYDALFDIALFKFKNPKAVKPPGFATLGDASSLKAENGKKFYVFGNPIGLDFLVSDEGILMREKFYARDASAGGLLPFDSTCNPGNSGGPVVDESGKVVGIVQAISGDRPICLAIPINNFRAILLTTQNDGPVRHGILGIEAQRNTINGKNANRVVVTKVGLESATGRAGIRVGDYLLSYFDKGGVERPIESAGRFAEEFQLAFRLGDTLTLKTLRGESVVIRSVSLTDLNTHQSSGYVDLGQSAIANAALDKKKL